MKQFSLIQINIKTYTGWHIYNILSTNNNIVASFRFNRKWSYNENICIKLVNIFWNNIEVNSPCIHLISKFFCTYIYLRNTCIILVFPTAGAPNNITLTRSIDSGLISMGDCDCSCSCLSFVEDAFWRLSKKSRSNSVTKEQLYKKHKMHTKGNPFRHLFYQMNTDELVTCEISTYLISNELIFHYIGIKLWYIKVFSRVKWK